MSNDLVRITKGRATGKHILRVRFAGDPHDRELDLTGLIAHSVHFAPLASDLDAFAKVAIVEDGLGVAWPVRTKWGPLDVSALTLQRIAEESE